MRRFLVSVVTILAGAGLTIAVVPAESLAQGSPQTAAPPVVVTAPATQCSLGFALVGKKCVFKQCPPNYRLVNRKCEKIQIHINSGAKCSLAEKLADKCKPEPVKASDFVPNKCPAGQHADGKTCVKDEPVKASDFVPKKCPSGQHYNGKACVKN